jgi:hypothetical protein
VPFLTLQVERRRAGGGRFPLAGPDVSGHWVGGSISALRLENGAVYPTFSIWNSQPRVDSVLFAVNEGFSGGFLSVLFNRLRVRCPCGPGHPARNTRPRIKIEKDEEKEPKRGKSGKILLWCLSLSLVDLLVGESTA